MKWTMQWTFCGLLCAALAACGGSGSTGGTDRIASRSTLGTMTKTSASMITVNGRSFDVSGAAIRVDDRPATADALRTGMRVRVRSTGDDRSGRASKVEEEDEVRGAVTAVTAGTTPQFFNIGDVKVIVDDRTVFDDLVPASFAAIQVGVFVEVNGMRNAAGEIVASRVEGKGVRDPDAPEADELRGVIGTIDAGASQFTLGTVVVSFTPATVFKPAPQCSAASLAAGLEVEVHGAFTAANAFAATRIDCEDLEDEDMDAEEGEEDSVEGFVTDLDTNARTFSVNGQAVSYSPNTEFEHGTLADLVNDARVEVEGRTSGGVLMANEIEFEDGH